LSSRGRRRQQGQEKRVRRLEAEIDDILREKEELEK